MAKDTVDFSLGDLYGKMEAMKETVDNLKEKTEKQQTTIDKALGGFGFIKWAVSGIGILQVISIVSNML